MLRRMFTKKVILMIAISFSLFLTYLVPTEHLYELEPIQELVYVDSEVKKDIIYLLDPNHYVARTSVVVSKTDVVEKAKELLEILIQGGKGESKIPSGFQSLIPSETKINSLSFEEGLIKVDFSSTLLDTKKENEEKIVEAIVYTLTSIEGVDKIIIYVEGEVLTKLPQTGLNLPSTLDKSYGINKEYHLDSYKEVEKVTIYYVSKYNNNSYYVPVTKYVNDDREKIKIIVDELASSYLNDSNLMSFLNSNTKLLATEKELDSLFLVFNEYLFSDMSTKNILEEVIYTISLSVGANYDVKEVIFEVGNEEIYKSVIKTIENS